MGLVLLIVAFLLSAILFLPSALHFLFAIFVKRKGWPYANTIFRRSAYAFDVFLNVAYGPMLNDLFSKGGYPYGKKNESISSATGKKQVEMSNTTLGNGLAGFLNTIDPSHCYKSIEGENANYYRSFEEPKSASWSSIVLFSMVAMLAFSLLISLLVWIF